MAGATGLDYAGVLAWMQATRMPPAQRPEIMRGIQAAERATLAVWAEQRQLQAQQQTPL